MLEFDFDIVYKPGNENTVPDFLSRNPVSAVDVKYDALRRLQNEDDLISCLKSDLLQNSQDEKFQKIKPFLYLENDILYHISKDGRYHIFAPESIQADILQSAHNSRLGGHMGIYKTSQRIIGSYFWPSMNHDVEQHVKSCIDCQKIHIQSMPGPL